MTKYESPSADDRRIWDLWLTQTYQGAVVAADDAGIFDALADEPARIEDLARRLDFDLRATGILLRLLAALGFLASHDGIYRLTDLARTYLLKASEFYWGNMLRVGASEWHRDTLLAKLKEKGSAEAAGPEGTPRASGSGRPADGWATGQIHLEQAARIAASMHSHSLPAAIGAGRIYDFSGVKRILDVGGGSGCFMIAFAQAHPHIEATVMELPAMCEVAAQYIKEGGVQDRVDTIAIDMFRDAWPKGYDAIFFSNIWHDWNFRTCAWLAERAYEALPAGGRIMLHEMLLDDHGNGPPAAASFSMLMLLATQGQQFTFAELDGLLTAAGFTDTQPTPTAGYYSIVTSYRR